MNPFFSFNFVLFFLFYSLVPPPTVSLKLSHTKMYTTLISLIFL